MSHEVLDLFGETRYLQTAGHLDSAGRARGLSGAPNGARGRRSSTEDLHRLDPDGWLGQPTTDSNSIESPASREDQRANSHRADFATGHGICGKLLRTFQQIPQPRRRRDGITSSHIPFGGPSHPVLGKPYSLDRELLMGGTYSVAPIRHLFQQHPHYGLVTDQREVVPVSKSSAKIAISTQRPARSCRAGLPSRSASQTTKARLR